MNVVWKDRLSEAGWMGVRALVGGGICVGVWWFLTYVLRWLPEAVLKQ
jgi:hypothetical protein